jgi:hypothetical protein
MTAKVLYASGISDAKEWASSLVLREMRCPGDMENAMHRLESRYGITWRIFHNLKYRPPADVLVGVWRQLKAAYELECERQERLLAHERHIAEATVLAFEALDSTTADGAGGEGI